MSLLLGTIQEIITRKSQTVQYKLPMLTVQKSKQKACGNKSLFLSQVVYKEKPEIQIVLIQTNKNSGSDSSVTKNF